METLPLDILIVIVQQFNPRTIELVCKHWRQASKNRRYLGKYIVPTAKLLTYPYLETFEGVADTLTPELMTLKCDITVMAQNIDPMDLVNIYPIGSGKTVRLFQPAQPIHCITYDGKRLTIKSIKRLKDPDEPKPTRLNIFGMLGDMQSYWATVRGNIALFRELNDNAKEDRLRSFLRDNEGYLSLKWLKKASEKLGKIDIDFIIDDIAIDLIPQIEVGTVRFWSVNRGPVSVSCVIGNLMQLKFDQAELYMTNPVPDNTEIAGIKLFHIDRDDPIFD